MLQGLVYFLDTPFFHVVLKPLLPKLAFLLKDVDLRVWVFVVHFLLVTKGICDLPFHKVRLSIFSNRVERLAKSLESWILYSFNIKYCNFWLVCELECMCGCFMLIPHNIL